MIDTDVGAAGSEVFSVEPSDTEASGSGTVETVLVSVEESRPFLTTDFSDYTVTEGLLLLIFVMLLLKFFLDLIRRWF
ncbi:MULTISPECIES: hypothetical protein [unclassified Oscillibacter]|uniref:hypothetical protein n=1 Tax=unclassified Oscillibacter TaxID=2629304 RepID=UPI0025FD0466|nr:MULTISPECIES: hypothetical protein [unclassified Oscillibacter]